VIVLGAVEDVLDDPAPAPPWVHSKPVAVPQPVIVTYRRHDSPFMRVFRHQGVGERLLRQRIYLGLSAHAAVVTLSEPAFPQPEI
jgi:hypothetical protein